MKKLTFVDILALIFIVLKLTGTITWSWFFVLLPIIIEVVIRIIVAVITE